MALGLENLSGLKMALGVINCIDGSHIPIIAPQKNEFANINLKNFTPSRSKEFAAQTSYSRCGREMAGIKPQFFYFTDFTGE